MSDEATTLNRLYFTNTTTRMDAQILKDHVIFTKDKSDVSGSREYEIYYGLVVNALDVKFVLTRHLSQCYVTVRWGCKIHTTKTIS